MEDYKIAYKVCYNMHSKEQNALCVPHHKVFTIYFKKYSMEKVLFASCIYAFCACGMTAI